MKPPDNAVPTPVATVAVEQRQDEVARRVVEALPPASEYLLTADDTTLALREELIEQALTGDGVTAPAPVSASMSMDNLMATLNASLTKA